MSTAPWSGFPRGRQLEESFGSQVDGFLVFIDLNGLMYLNSDVGHQVGEVALLATWHALRRGVICRSSVTLTWPGVRGGSSGAGSSR
jgi:hypothetical protein